MPFSVGIGAGTFARLGPVHLKDIGLTNVESHPMQNCELTIQGAKCAVAKKVRAGYVRFKGLLTLAERLLARNDADAAVCVAQIAAHHAFTIHSGLFASYRLERLLLALGCRIQATSSRRRGRLRHVLHVLTHARHVGGDTRCVRRWIQQDRYHKHSVAITKQGDLEIPEALAEAVARSGGMVRALKAPLSRPFDKARELKILSREVDAIILHLYPDDIIPVLAFASNDDCLPIAFAHHSDHTFWIAGSVANVVVHFRKQALEFLTERRGLDVKRSAILPLPLAHGSRTLSRDQAKRALGYRSDIVLLLTIATPFKYRPIGSISFLDLVVPVLKQIPEAMLIAVGPELEGAWYSASVQTDRRIVPLGRRWDNDILYAAADIYLDSFPFSSITSLLEAGSQGTALLAYYPPNPEPWLLSPGAPGLEGAMDLAGDAVTYRRLLTRLIRDIDFRYESGEKARERIVSLHTGNSWAKSLGSFYQILERSAGQRCFLGTSDVFDDSALDLAVAKLMSSGSADLAIDRYLADLPYLSRAPVLWHLLTRGFDFSLSLLLPPALERLVAGHASWAGRILRRALQLRWS